MLPQFLARIRAFLDRRQHQEDLYAELHDHIEQEIARNLARGLAPEEARRAARLAIGNLTMHAEDGRTAVTGVWFEQFVQDLRYAGRGLRRNKSFALVAILSLGFGIGATTTMFSTVDALDFRPLPFRESDRLVSLAEVAPLSESFCPGCSSSVAPPTALDWFAALQSYDAVGVVADNSLQIVHDDAIEQVGVHAATSGFFQLLGVRPALGREFLASDTLSGAAPVVIVSDKFWRKRLAADPLAIGQPLPESGDARTDASLRGAIVIGVLPQSFRFEFTRDREVWVPLHLAATAARTSRSLTVVGRVRRDVSTASADAELRVIASRLAALYPIPYESWGARVEPLRVRLGWGAGANRHLLFGITALVLFVAVINVAGLMAGRATARRQEFAMRNAFGASRRRLLRQLIVEGLSIGLAGGAVGALLTMWGIRFASVWFGVDTGVALLDVRVVVFALVLSISVGVATALGPAWRISRVDLIGDLRARNMTANRGPSGFGSNTLIIAQVALALVLITGAASLSADFMRLRYTDLGFRPSGVFTTSVSIPRAPGQDPEQWRVLALAAQASVAGVPGVEAAALEYRSAIHPEIVRTADNVVVLRNTSVLTAVDARYFSTWGVALMRGRLYGAADNAGAARVAVVNQAAARRFWPGADALGRQLFVGDSGAPGELLTVIGVISDAERGEMAERHWPMVYRPLAQATIWHTGGSLQIRIDDRANPGVVLALAQARLREVLQRPADPFRSSESSLDERFKARRLNAIALDLFAAFALLLAAMGVYGSIGATVRRRTREIGVRLALGATQTGTMRLIVGRGLALASVGVALGLLGATAMAGLLRSLVASTDVFDPQVFAVAAIMMLGTAAIAAWLPARRVMSVDPMEALRAE